MSIPGLATWNAPWFTLVAWNALAPDTQITELAKSGVLIATIHPGFLEFPSMTYLHSDWVKFSPERMQAEADKTGGVVITNG